MKTPPKKQIKKQTNKKKEGANSKKKKVKDSLKGSFPWRKGDAALCSGTEYIGNANRSTSTEYLPALQHLPRCEHLKPQEGAETEGWGENNKKKKKKGKLKGGAVAVMFCSDEEKR